MAKTGFIGPLTNRVKVRIYFYGLTIEINNFAFEVKVIQGLESILLGGWLAEICKTITNSASAKAEVEARLSLATNYKSMVADVREIWTSEPIKI